MRLHRFYIGEAINNKAAINIKSADLVNQIRRVFRLKTNDQVILFDGSGSDYICRIENFGKDNIDFTIVESQKSRYVAKREVVLCSALVKKDTFEWIAEKATELGVTRIIPVLAERSEKKSLNMERLQKIVTEASEQSGRGDIPKVSEVVSLQRAIDMIKTDFTDNVSMVAFHTEGESLLKSGIKSKIDDINNTSPIVALIGPEGGWSPDEIDLFHKENIPVISLGPQILRAETAAIVAISQLVF